MHYYKKHIKDYIADTSHLTMLEHGAYNILIDTYVITEQPLTLDLDKLFRKVCAKTEDEQKAIVSILDEFFKKTDDGYTHKRIASEIKTYIEIGERSRENGKKGGKPRTNPLGPLTINQEPQTKNQYIDRFEEFWDTYPHRNGHKRTKKDSVNWWQKQSLDTLTIVLKATKIYKKYIEKCHNDKVFDGGVPDPIRYLKNERYLDELDVKPTNSAFAGGHK